MSQSIDKPNTNVPTDLVLGSGIVFREVRKTWNRATKAEMRLELLKNLQVNCLGLPDVEHFVTKRMVLQKLLILELILLVTSILMRMSCPS